MIPFSTLAITNEASWNSVRVGLGFKAAVSPRLTFSGEFAYILYSEIDNAEIHHLSSLVSSFPRVRHEGYGTGMQLEAFADYRLTERWSLGVGARYWRLNAEGDLEFEPASTLPRFPMEFESERYGIFVQTSLTF